MTPATPATSGMVEASGPCTGIGLRFVRHDPSASGMGRFSPGSTSVLTRLPWLPYVPITVAVPDTWVDIDTTPRANGDGTVMPSIEAATNIQTFTETFDEPGVLYRAIAYDPDHQGLMDRYGLTGGCRLKDVVPYDDGAFVGLHGTWSDCGPEFDPEWHQVVASPPSQSFAVVLQIQITGPDQASVVDNVLASFNFTPQGGSTTGPFLPTTNPGDTTTTTSPAQTTTSPAQPTTSPAQTSSASGA